MVSVTPRTPWRMSHRVAEDLRRRILRGELDPGVRLPPLPALASELGISEHHLREALRLLEQDGLVRVASGRNGGVFVTPPEQAGLTRSFGLVLARAGALLSDLMEARADIEPVIAARAAVEATDEDLAKLESVLTTHADLGGPRPGINAEFHLAVAAASHNQTFLTTLTAMEEMLISLDLRVARRELVGESLRAHRAILKAITARDAAKAAAVTRQHVLGYMDEMAASGIELRTYRIADLLDDIPRSSLTFEAAE